MVKHPVFLHKEHKTNDLARPSQPKNHAQIRVERGRPSYYEQLNNEKACLYTEKSISGHYSSQIQMHWPTVGHILYATKYLVQQGSWFGEGWNGTMVYYGCAWGGHCQEFFGGNKSQAFHFVHLCFMALIGGQGSSLRTIPTGSTCQWPRMGGCRG